MGKHFVPQAHLRRFECPDRPGFVWMYDKVQRKFLQPSIVNAAQSRKFYDDDVEKGLAETIEGPANPAIAKLQRGEPLDNSERTSASLYLLTMATRGPRHRRKTLEEIAPKALESTINQFETEIRAWLEECPNDPRAHARMAELQATCEKFSKEHPSNIIEISRTPFFSDRTVLCVHNMIWRLAPAPPPTFYITCDTPTHFSEWAGVGTPGSELTFPIAPDLALFGAHTGQPASTIYIHPQADLVDEANRRMVNCAERFIFSHVKRDWIAEWADSPPAINRIQWQ